MTAADYEEVLADHRRLVREFDVAMHGEEGAAKQASLCDLIGPARVMAANARRYIWMREQHNTFKHYVDGVFSHEDRLDDAAVDACIADAAEQIKVGSGR